MNPVFELPHWMRMKDVVKCCAIPEGTVRQLAREKKIHAHRLGDREHCAVVYSRVDAERWIEAQPELGANDE
jgi:hypothetical protein